LDSNQATKFGSVIASSKRSSGVLLINSPCSA